MKIKTHIINLMDSRAIVSIDFEIGQAAKANDNATIEKLRRRRNDIVNKVQQGKSYMETALNAVGSL